MVRTVGIAAIVRGEKGTQTGNDYQSINWHG
jgi:hypothetical protein